MNGKYRNTSIAGAAGRVASELAEEGIPKEDIVLAFRPGHVRPHTGYGGGLKPDTVYRRNDEGYNGKKEP